MRHPFTHTLLTCTVAAALAATGFTGAAAQAAPPDHAKAAPSAKAKPDNRGNGQDKTDRGNGKDKDKTHPGKGGGKKPKEPAPTPTPTPDPVEVTWSVAGNHPQAQQQATVRGSTLHDLAVTPGGQIVAGYGDYGENTGPIELNPFDPVGQTFGGSQVSVGSEEVNVFRDLSGALYAPMIDPKSDANAPAGYATNAHGSWSSESKIAAVHLYDMAERVPGELWMVGSANKPGGGFGGATAYRSTDGGQTWAIERQETNTDPTRQTGYERYYWVAALDGKVYVRAHSVDGAATMSFDGTRWSSVSAAPCTSVLDANETAVFNGLLLCARPYLQAFDGKRVQTFDYTHPMTNTVDFHEADGYLYALTSSGNVGRTADGTTWQLLTSTAPSGSASIAVVDGRIHLGTTAGQILRADVTVGEMVGQTG